MSRASATRAPLQWFGVWRALGYLLLASVVVLSLAPTAPNLPGDSSNWSGHLLAYATLTGWFCRLYPHARQRGVLLLALIGLGVVLEFLQGLSGWRTTDPYDMLANSGGVLCGWLIAPPRLPNGLPHLERLIVAATSARL